MSAARRQNNPVPLDQSVQQYQKYSGKATFACIVIIIFAIRIINIQWAIKRSCRLVKDAGFCSTCLLAGFKIYIEGEKQDRERAVSPWGSRTWFPRNSLPVCWVQKSGSIYGRAKASRIVHAVHVLKMQAHADGRQGALAWGAVNKSDAQAARSWERERATGVVIIKTAPRAAACACGTSPNKWESFTQNEKMRRGSDWLTDGCTARGPPKHPLRSCSFNAFHVNHDCTLDCTQSSFKLCFQHHLFVSHLHHGFFVDWRYEEKMIVSKVFGSKKNDGIAQQVNMKKMFHNCTLLLIIYIIFQLLDMKSCKLKYNDKAITAYVSFSLQLFNLAISSILMIMIIKLGYILCQGHVSPLSIANWWQWAPYIIRK